MIRNFTPTDLPHVTALFGPETRAAAGQHLERQLDEGARLLVYRAEGVARGCLLWRVQAGQEGARWAVLDHVTVSPSWRRRGLARRLVGRFAEESFQQGCVAQVEPPRSPSMAATGFLAALATWQIP
ncbi:hypothetical protein GCM10011415_09470 [Salipiger pallidus]|uniref:N-acetyltransferase domain-containing protein n=1 Tax=Salipiger pallidus TaxID=1775170 RepID=A0A8J3EEM2_9RHOB|nr:GNAT family N-acetyltransferase [Salipiger pallidus]GGG64865.1 hypothetical protein GCM10011415_09470 [Salipiger pallidus]